MERITLPDGISADERIFYNALLDGAAPLPLELTAAPTTVGGELKEGQIGIFGTHLFQTINGVTYSLPLTAV